MFESLAISSILPEVQLAGTSVIPDERDREDTHLTILVPAKRTIDIPVSCVEVGRWSHISDRFASADRAVYASLRARKTVQVSASLAVSGQRHADQGAIWDDIEIKSSRMRARSLLYHRPRIYSRPWRTPQDVEMKVPRERRSRFWSRLRLLPPSPKRNISCAWAYR